MRARSLELHQKIIFNAPVKSSALKKFFYLSKQNLYIYIYIYICVCVCVYICMYICIYIYIYIKVANTVK